MRNNPIVQASMPWRLACATALSIWLGISAIGLVVLQHWHARERRVAEEQGYSLVHALANTLRTMGGPVVRDEVQVADVFAEIVATPFISGVALVGSDGGHLAGVGIAPGSIETLAAATKGAVFLDHDLLVWDTVNVGACVRPMQQRRGWRRQLESPDLSAERASEAPVPARLFVSVPLAHLQARWRRDALTFGVFSLGVLAACLGLVRHWHLLRRSAEYSAKLRVAAEEQRSLAEMNLVAAGLAHEIKNPLGIVRGTAQRLAQSRGGTGEAADLIVQEIDRVTSRINELMLFAKPRAPELADVSIVALCRDVGGLLADELADAGLTLKEPPRDLAVRADREQLRQVLFNLLHNAVRFAPASGEVDVSLRREKDGSATLTVRDHGPGIPSASREAVFSPYVTTSPAGSGLGLAIAKRICSAHGWSITCIDPGGGAAFEIRGMTVADSAPIAMEVPGA